MAARIDRIEIHKHLFLEDFCALIYLSGDDFAIARVDNLKITYKSTLASRLAGVDNVLANVTLERLMSHPQSVVKNSSGEWVFPERK